MDRYKVGLVFWDDDLRASVALSDFSQHLSHLNMLEPSTSEEGLQEHCRCGSNGDKIR